MKKTYINPSTTIISFVSAMVCQVGSVHGDSGMQFGGAADGSDPAIKPM